MALYSPIPTAFSAPGVGNVFIPGFDDALNLIVGYSRNDKKFPFLNYCTMKTGKVWAGLYPKFDPHDLMRINYANGRDFLFPDGTPRPVGTNNYTNNRFSWLQYQMQRYSYNGSIGYLTTQQSGWDVKKKLLDDLATKAMIQKAYMALTEVTTTTNYPSSHVATAASWGGGTWLAGTINTPTIGPSLAKIRSTILKDTAGKVRGDELVLVVNPDLAYQMALTQEIRAFVAQQAGSLQVLEGKNPGMRDNWLLPDNLYGFKIIIEDTPIVTGLKDADPTGDSVSYILGAGTAFVVARPGSLDGDAGGSEFSTLHCLQYKEEEMLMETFDEPKHRLIDIYITDSFTFLVPAGESGAIITTTGA